MAEVGGVSSDRLARGLYTMVGFGVLAVQRVAGTRHQAQRRLKPLIARVDAVIDPVVDEVEQRLSGPPAAAFHKARTAARAGRRVFLGS